MSRRYLYRGQTKNDLIGFEQKIPQLRPIQR